MLSSVIAFVLGVAAGVTVANKFGLTLPELIAKVKGLFKKEEAKVVTPTVPPVKEG